jgi:cysteine desulfurase / selenocysteine lyase
MNIWDAKRIRAEFPIFQHHPDLIYLDNAATTQKPRSVLDAERDFYERNYANVHRGIYPLAARATQLYEQSRQKVAQFINVSQAENIVFTRGSTEGLNLVAQSFLGPKLNPGDEVLVSGLEHHSNLLPWQNICRVKGAILKIIPFFEDGTLDLQFLQENLGHKTKLLAFSHISNSLGTVHPVAEMASLAKEKGIPVLLDAAQSVATHRIDVQTWDLDFLVFSGHKMYGPSGIGVLYGKSEHLKKMPPYQLGGEMIRDVTYENSLYAAPPKRFEAGTPNAAGAIGLGAAIDFLQKLDLEAVLVHQKKLLDYATKVLLEIPGMKIFGQAREKSGIISFTLDDLHPHDLATLMGEKEICVRAGQHCTQPVMDFYDIPGTLRISLAMYNHEAEIDALVQGINFAKQKLGAI